MGADWAGFGDDVDGIGGLLSGFGGAAFGGEVSVCGCWDGWRDGGGTDLRRLLTMVRMGEGQGQWGSVTDAYTVCHREEYSPPEADEEMTVPARMGTRELTGPFQSLETSRAW